MRRLFGIAMALLCTSLIAAALAPRALLPSGWTLTPAAGPVGTTGTFPQGIALSPDGQIVAVLESGAGPAGLRLFDAQTLHERAYLPLKGAFGKPVWDGSDHLWIALGNLHAVARVTVATASIDRTIDTGAQSWAAAVALSPDGTHVAFSDDSTAHAGIIDVASGSVTQRIPTDKHPGDLAYAPDGLTLAVANRGSNTLTLINPLTAAAKTIEVGNHPSALAFSADAMHVYVTLADDDALAMVNVATASVTNRVPLGVSTHPGVSPNALAIASDGTAFVACGALDALAAVSGGKRIGMLPAGWYPDGVALSADGRTAFVLNARGEGSRANPEFNPFAGHMQGYIASSLTGSVRKIDVRAGWQNAQVLAGMHQPAAAPVQTVLRANGPIRHVIYVIKENRTYDQVLSDVPGGDGDQSLLLFGAATTPNQHAIAQRFGLFDRAFADAQVSADGHNWTDGAFANDYLNRFWPPVYGNRRVLYDFEDGADASVPHNGFLWDAAARAKISYRNYGEFVTNPSTTGSEVTTQEPNLKGHTSAAYPGFDMQFSDQQRFAIWLREFRTYEAGNNLPALEFVRFPNDHTSGTKPGNLTPPAYVAQNDYAFGELVDTVSHSRFWRSTVIIAVEDDAQNGPDHVDEQRTTFYVASPYARGRVDHTHYSSSGAVRTIELILGLPPLSLYDAQAQPMYAAFTAKPNFKPYAAIKPTIDLNAINKKTAYGAAISARMDFRDADRADAAQLNDILYRSAGKTP